MKWPFFYLKKKHFKLSQKRWIDIEFIKSAFNGIIKYGRDAIDAMIKAIENPYKSMVKILKSLGLFTSNSSDKINAKL